MYDDLPLVDNQAAHNFELIVEGRRAFIDYVKRGDVYLLIHTEVPKELEGRGIAAALVLKVFNYLEANGSKMKPYCQYVQFYLRKHPEWNRLMAK